MAEHKRNKAGLHKGISSIFKGVLIPQADGGQEPSGPPAPERTDCTEPKQPAPETQKTEVPKAYQATQTLPKTAPEHTATEPKQPTPETQKPQGPKAYQATQTLPKTLSSYTNVAQNCSRAHRLYQAKTAGSRTAKDPGPETLSS